MLEYPLLTRSHTGKVRKAADIFVKQIAQAVFEANGLP